MGEGEGGLRYGRMGQTKGFIEPKGSRRRVRVRGEYGFSSPMKQNKKGKNCAVFCFAGFFFLNFFCYEVIVKQKIYKRSTIHYCGGLLPSGNPSAQRQPPSLSACRQSHQIHLGASTGASHPPRGLGPKGWRSSHSSRLSCLASAGIRAFGRG